MFDIVERNSAETIYYQTSDDAAVCNYSECSISFLTAPHLILHEP